MEEGESDPVKVTEDMWLKAESSMPFFIMASLSQKMRARLPTGLERMPIWKILRAVNDKSVNKTESHEDELRAVANK